MCRTRAAAPLMRLPLHEPSINAPGEAGTIKNTAIATELALPPVKIHCSVLAEDAIKAAITDYKKKNGHNDLDNENG